jgi:hypothetical protein
MRITIMAAAALLIASAAPLDAGLLEYNSYGNQSFAAGAAGQVANARGLSQAGAGHLANPALAALAAPVEAQASFQTAWRRETRNREVFDSYSNSVGLNTESVNSEIHYYLKSLSLGYARKYGALPRLGIGLGLAAEYDFDYSYHRETRDGFFALTRTDDIKGKGRIYGLTGSLACQPLPYVALGLGFTSLSGRQTVDQAILMENPVIPDVTTTTGGKYSGTRMNLGLWGALTNRLSLGLGLRSKAKLKANIDFTVDDTSFTKARTVTYPGEYAAAVTYRPTNAFPATVSLEYAYIPWNKLADDLNPDLRLKAVNRYSVGITHVVADAVPLRLGISFANSYISNGIGLASAGLGADLSLWKLKTQIAASVSKRAYNMGQAYGTNDPINVSETMADLVITFGLR